MKNLEDMTTRELAEASEPDQFDSNDEEIDGLRAIVEELLFRIGDA